MNFIGSQQCRLFEKVVGNKEELVESVKHVSSMQDGTPCERQINNVVRVSSVEEYARDRNHK